MRARGGGVLSASALVAVGTSLLLAVLVGVGVKALGAGDRSGTAAGMRAETAAVVVPGSTDPAKPVRHQVRRHRAATVTVPQPVVVPTVSTTTASRPLTRPTSTTSTRTSTMKSSSPVPTATPTHGKAKGSGKGNGHQKPAKR